MKDARLDRLAEGLAGCVQVGDPADPVAEAAVAVVLRLAPGPEVLLIRRTSRDGDPWSGHIAFPGGRRSSADADLAATAVRETREETGLDLARDGRILGRLDDVLTPSTLPRLRVAAYVVALVEERDLVLDPREVAEATWMSLSTLRDPATLSQYALERNGTLLTFPSLNHGGYVIWGMTHRFLSRFIERLTDAGF